MTANKHKKRGSILCRSGQRGPPGRHATQGEGVGGAAEAEEGWAGYEELAALHPRQRLPNAAPQSVPFLQLVGVQVLVVVLRL